MGARALVHVELKTPYGHVGPLEQRVHEIIIDHAGPVCVIGFNPYSHAWFADHHPQILRGLDSYAYNDDSARHLAPEQRKAFANLEHVEIARPDFLALDAKMLPSPRADLYRSRGMPIIAWTVRDPLPTIPIPLLSPDPDIPLDIAPLYDLAYQNGRYGHVLKYDQPVDMPLDEGAKGWVRNLATGASKSENPEPLGPP